MRMTEEKAIEWLNNLIETMKSETSGNYPDPEYKDEVYEALDIAIEALEQESILDKIRAEIMQLYKRIYDHRHEIILAEDSEYKRGLLSFSDWVLDLMTSNFDYEYKAEINLQESEDDIENEEQAESEDKENETTKS